MIGSIPWYATRGAGIVSLVLFTVVLTIGIVTAGRWQSRSWPRFLTAKLHRDLALLSVVFLALHIVIAVVDPYTALGPLAALIPFSVDYKRLGLGLGVIALDLGIAVMVTSLLRSRFGPRTWRTVHWLSYAAWPIAVLHSVATGTDASALWMQAIVVASVSVVVAATALRFLVVEPEPARRAAPAASRGSLPFVAGGPVDAGRTATHGVEPVRTRRVEPTLPVVGRARPRT